MEDGSTVRGDTIAVTEACQSVHEHSQRGKVALDDDEVQVKVPPVVVVESISSTVVSFCPQLF